ncbi:MAG: hemerythrin domain-containing protein [Sulfurimonas sp.]|uniref:hemerythrin domain-containing protein n=1 Tax=Sulfurimonas sp. TaxID=2022749 RepID=UPI00261D7CE0|nr:hemerythrin domain-containing protein [Sulfurimonas sp.]MDD2652496.1 hemerythrin domain-containing protein [Sulfurimonas sp.]MDD3452233.1 hemerythrin domain-containing protein [Sulfurimonas sp.]
MSDIKEFLTNDHRACDEEFALLEEAVAAKNSDAPKLYEKFSSDLTNHFSMEEIVLFPMLGQASSVAGGAIKAMEMEHEQMRTLLSKMRKAVESMDKESFFSLSETLMILMQQHNMKEEQLLYTLAEQHLGEDADHIVRQMRSVAY